MNYWKQFAEILSLELEQEFVLTDDDGSRKYKYTYKITDDGLLYKSPTYNWAISSLGIIEKLLNGDVKAVTKPWKPEKGERFWYYSDAVKQNIYSRWCGGNYDLLLWKSGNCFKNEEEAKTKGKEIIEKIKKEYEEN